MSLRNRSGIGRDQRAELGRLHRFIGPEIVRYGYAGTNDFVIAIWIRNRRWGRKRGEGIDSRTDRNSRNRGNDDTKNQ